jgi:Tol biopolymer transport system component
MFFSQQVCSRRFKVVLRRMSFLVALVVVGAATLLLHEYLFAMSSFSTPSPARPGQAIGEVAQNGSDLRIAFVSTLTEGQETFREIFTMNITPQGVGEVSTDTPVNISNSRANDHNPAWSPDGTQIIFQTDRDGNDEIYMMQQDGRMQTRLTTHSADDRFPNWSPDGKKIVFASKRDGNWEIYTMDLDGTNIQRRTNNENEDAYPDWSPDGKKIAFASTRDNNWEIYTIDAEGSGTEEGLTRLTTSDTYDDTHPTWSGNSTRIIFASSLEDLSLKESRIVEIRASNGAKIRDWQKTTSGLYEAPSWSPDGEYLSYAYDTDNNVYLINVAQSGSPILLTTDGLVEGNQNTEASLWTLPLPGELVFLPLIRRGRDPYICPPTPTPTPTPEVL